MPKDDKVQQVIKPLGSKPRMEQERNRNLALKFDNTNRVSKQWMDQMGSVIDNQFQIMGEKQTQWNQKLDDSFIDKSLNINADTIIENVKMVMNHIKENPPLKELNNKLIMAIVAFQTASMTASPAFADQIETLTQKDLQGNISYS